MKSELSGHIQALERALAVAEGVEAQVGYDILVAATKRFVRSQRVYPQDTIQVPKIVPFHSGGCQNCGLHGAHYCVGKRSETGQYWFNQPTSLLNTGGIGSSVGSGMGAVGSGGGVGVHVHKLETPKCSQKH